MVMREPFEEKSGTTRSAARDTSQRRRHGSGPSTSDRPSGCAQGGRGLGEGIFGTRTSGSSCISTTSQLAKSTERRKAKSVLCATTTTRASGRADSHAVKFSHLLSSCGTPPFLTPGLTNQSFGREASRQKSTSGNSGCRAARGRPVSQGYSPHSCRSGCARIRGTSAPNARAEAQASRAVSSARQQGELTTSSARSPAAAHTAERKSGFSSMRPLACRRPSPDSRGSWSFLPSSERPESMSTLCSACPWRIHQMRLGGRPGAGPLQGWRGLIIFLRRAGLGRMA
mmetsp:Transcript_109186/g.340273  ORF Transcript_109186/g.340273 Transcript_109186/m.340273 type:complete len:285 (-) Transcript_109186:4-858(-)